MMPLQCSRGIDPAEDTESEFMPGGTIGVECGSRGIDPAEDTESFYCMFYKVIACSSRGIDPAEDTESPLKHRNDRAIEVAEASIRQRILKAKYTLQWHLFETRVG